MVSPPIIDDIRILHTLGSETPTTGPIDCYSFHSVTVSTVLGHIATSFNSCYSLLQQVRQCDSFDSFNSFYAMPLPLCLICISNKQNKIEINSLVQVFNFAVFAPAICQSVHSWKKLLLTSVWKQIYILYWTMPVSF